ncbi:MAG: hypothetical protein ACM3SS_02730 [Rhodospirillaceae bacterium]
MDAKAIGARIVEARKLKGIPDYRALATLLRQNTQVGVKVLSPETVRLWEVGKKIPPYDKVEQLVQVLGEPEEWILFGIRRGEQLREERRFLSYISDEEMLLLSSYRRASDAGKKIIREDAETTARRFPGPVAELKRFRAK